MIVHVYRVTVSNYLTHPFRSFLVLFALVIATAGLSSVLILNETALQSYEKASKPLVNGVGSRINARPGQAITKRDYAALRRDGFTSLVAAVSDTLRLELADGTQAFIPVYGVDSFALLSLSSNHTASDRQTFSGTFSQLWSNEQSAQGSILIHSNYANELNVGNGQSLTTTNGVNLPPLAITDTDMLGRELVTDIAILQSTLGFEEISEIWVVGNDTELDYKALETRLPPHLILQRTFGQDDAKQLEESFHLNILAMSLLMFAVCMFVVMNALNLLLVKRLDNFKILRQLGIHRKTLLLGIVLELVLLCFLMTPIGFVLGQFAAQLLSPAVSKTLENLYGAHISYSDMPALRLLFIAFASSLVGALLAAALPVWTLNRRLATHNASAGNTTSNSHFLWLLISVALLSVALAVFLLSEGLVPAFVVLGAIMLAGCSVMIWSLPLLISAIHRILPQHLYRLKYTMASSLQVSAHSKIAFCAFFIAIATNTGMNLMVDSFRLATHDWLEQRLNAQAYIRTAQPVAIEAWFAENHPNVELVPRLTRKAKLENGNEVTLRFQPVTHNFQSTVVMEQSEADIWQTFAGGNTVLVNQQLFLSKRLSLGESISFSDEALDGKTFSIGGVFLDYGNSSYEAILPDTLFGTTTRLASVYGLFGIDQPDGLKRSIKQSDLDTTIITTSELKSLSMTTFDRTFVITDSLNIVTLLVAAFSLASSLLVMSLDIKPQMALMRSLGFSRRSLLTTTMAQYAGLSLLVCLIAVPFGIILSWLLINLVNVQAFFWRYPLLVDWQVISFVVITSVLLVLLVLITPVTRVNSNKLSEEIKWLN